MPLCEIRIPTYRRPDLLRRALSSVAAQTQQDLRCIIFDDSPDREAEAAVAEFPQLDIHYRPNPENLGICRNLGRCFQTGPFTDAEYSFCLEDDHRLKPTFVEENITLLNQFKANIILRDQYHLNADGTLDTNRFFRRGYREGLHACYNALLSNFFTVGFPNGSIFWRTHAKSDLCVGLDCPEPVMQEWMRPFAVREPWVFVAKPLFVHDPGYTGGSFRLKGPPLSQTLQRRWRYVARLRIHQATISSLQTQGVWPEALCCLEPHIMATVEKMLAWTCQPPSWTGVARASFICRYVGGLTARALRGPSLGPTFDDLLSHADARPTQCQHA